MEKKTIYFLCTGNSCRSQMAEGWAKKHLGETWSVYSAGIEAHGLNPNAVKAMNEVNIDISNQTSDIIDSNLLNSADLVVTLCGDAADKCPISPPQVKREHWGFDDPAKAQGTDEEKWAVFQRVRDQIGERIRKFAQTDVRGQEHIFIEPRAGRVFFDLRIHVLVPSKGQEHISIAESGQEHGTIADLISI